MEGPEGLEPSTPGLRGPCSNQLSYGPAFASKIIVSYICKRAIFYCLWYNFDMKQEFAGQREDEKLLFHFRRHVLTMRKGFLATIVLILAGFVPYMFSSGNTNLLWIAFGCIILAIIIFLYHWVGWYFTVYIVTNQRIRQDRQKGLFNTSVVEIALGKIENIIVEKRGLMGNLFNYGTLVLQTSVGDLVVMMVPHPMEIREKLQKEVNRYRTEPIKESHEED